MEQIDRLLSGFVLSENERAVFKRMLESGMQRASNIARVSGMPRNTVRGVLDNLVKQGLVVRTRRANTHFYSVEKRDGLVRILERKKEVVADEIDSQIQLVKKLGKVLEPQTAHPKRPLITFYDGLDGVKRVYEDTLGSKEGLRSWASFDANQQAMPSYFPNYYRRRARRGITMKSIHPDTKMARESTRNNKKYLRRSVLVPAAKFKTGTEIQVYDNKVNIVSWQERFGVIIESQEIANTLKSIFELSYETARKFYRES